MKKSMIITGFFLIIIIIIILFPFKNNSVKNDLRGNLYAGSGTCMKCHNDIYNSYLHTAHYIASGPATANTIHGNFARNANVFYVNKNQKMIMENLDSGLFQTYYLNGKIKKKYRFDIVFGGVKGESYLHWIGNELYQLPISYYTRQNKWSTSPGYGFNFLDYPSLRSIKKQCMECHASYINDLPAASQHFNKEEQFDKNSIIYSIDCERCHGPAAQHVDFQTHNPAIKTARYITTYSSLNRSQKTDACAICHSGKPTQMLRSTFEFIPGDTFAKFKIPEFYESVDTAHLDVHGNQVQLLQSSKCYILSKAMTCTTCHDPHQNNRGMDALYTQKCLNCHNIEKHTSFNVTNKINTNELKANCINCHMPALPTKVISVQVSDTLPPIRFYVHTHHIAIYPQEVKKILAYINQ